MQLEIHEDQPPLDHEIYMVFVSKAIIRVEEDSPKVWIPVSELYPIGYVLLGNDLNKVKEPYDEAKDEDVD